MKNNHFFGERVLENTWYRCVAVKGSCMRACCGCEGVWGVGVGLEGRRGVEARCERRVDRGGGCWGRGGREGIGGGAPSSHSLQQLWVAPCPMPSPPAPDAGVTSVPSSPPTPTPKTQDVVPVFQRRPAEPYVL